MIIILLIIFLIIFLSSYMSFLERRILGLLQNRYGPNRVGLGGSMQLLADLLKIAFKEDWIPPFSDKIIFVISPFITLAVFLLLFSIIPISNNLVILNCNFGVLFFIFISSLSVYGIILAGYSSNNKYAFLGAVRSIAQVISYEVFMGISLTGVMIRSESFNLISIVDSQKDCWNVIMQFIGFLSFFIASLAICHRHPFDQPESEQEISDGYHIEYSGMKFGVFFIAEYVAMLALSMFNVILFFGGWLGPWLSPYLWFAIKVSFILFFFFLIRASLPRPRYDQIISFGWKFCLPLSLLNLLIVAIFNLK